jgi:predicted outer membrane repeat protein
MKTIKTMFFAALALLLMNACTDILLDTGNGESPAAGIAEGFGTIRLSLSQGEARNVIPGKIKDNLVFEYWFSRDGGEFYKVTPDEDDVFTLETGPYTLRVRAFTDGAEQTLVAEGKSEPFTVGPEGDVAPAVDVTLYPIVAGAGTGSLQFTLMYPAGATVETFTLKRIAGWEDPIDLTSGVSPSGDDTITFSGTKEDIPVGYYMLQVRLRNDKGALTGRVAVAAIYQNLSADTSYTFIEDDFIVYRVTSNADAGPWSLRDAIINAPEGQPIRVTLEEPGNVIELANPLEISKNLSIEGNGVVLTPAASWNSSNNSQLLRITSSTAVVSISRIHFKDGRAYDDGSAINNSGVLTLESCIFSGNQVTLSSAYGGAIFSGNTLTVRGCTFYGNTSPYLGGAVNFNASGKTLMLVGNLFSGNTAGTRNPVVYVNSGMVTAYHNVVDKDFGPTGLAVCGWDAGTGDMYSSAPLVSKKTFKALYGSAAAGRLPANLADIPGGYPVVEDFYGQKVSGGGQAGAVQALTTQDKYYLGLSVNNTALGTVTASPQPDEEGLVDAVSVTLTATPKAGTTYEFAYWLKDNERIEGGSPYTFTIGAHTEIQAVFTGRTVTVNTLADGAGDATNVTLRYALTNAEDGDVITFSGVTAGTTTIELTSALPQVTKSISIKGNGITLTRAASLASSRLLNIDDANAVVDIRGVHFKNGLYPYSGAAISSSGTLTLESCIFSGNQATDSGSSGGAISSNNTLTVRGCTFYGNSAAYSGGAVCFLASGKTLTLVGNLFYGNTASRFHVVNVLDGNGTVNASYNVVNVNFGTGLTACGWEQGTGDTYSNSMLVSGNSFKVIPGSEAVAKLPSSLPPGYPATDFYEKTVSGGGQAGAVQDLAANGDYSLGITRDKDAWGTVEVSASPPSAGDSMYFSNSSVTLTATAADAAGEYAYSFAYWQKDSERITDNPYTFTINAHTEIEAVFDRALIVNKFTDDAGDADVAGTLRYALTKVVDGETIRFTGVTAGDTTISLLSALPQVTQSITIEGNGITLTRSNYWTNNPSHLLYIHESATTVVKISGVHFQDGKATANGAAIYNGATLTLESCIFSGNQSTGNYTSGGAIYSRNTLTVRGCTFYGNSAVSYAGALYFQADKKTLTLVGNLFYGNTAPSDYPVVWVYYNTSPVAASYNVVDLAFGTETTACGWAAGAGDVYFTTPVVLPGTFKVIYGTPAAGNLPATLPDGYPVKDFYGQPVSGGGQAGAVQALTTQGKYYLGYSSNNEARGTVSSNPEPDGDSMVDAGQVTLTATQKDGYSFAYWRKGNERIKASNSYTFTIDSHTQIQAVFARVVTVDKFTDSAADATVAGTLRYALTNAEDGDVITFSGVTPGTTEIKLTRYLPRIIKSISIVGNGITLTRDASWTAISGDSRLLSIRGITTMVGISGVHFKDGWASDRGGAIENTGVLTLESCIFSGNQTTTGDTRNYGGAIYSENTLTVRGCTFYENSCPHNGPSSDYYGGAVYFKAGGKTLTLVGNLFYKNTAATSYPVVRVESGTSAASYNVVDLAFGTETTACGWTAGTGDKTFTSLSITGDPFNTTTFVPVNGLASVLTSRPADFPITDFNGETRTFPGAPGAVK